MTSEIVDHTQAIFDLPVAQPRMRHQRAVFGIDVGPIDPESMPAPFGA